MANSLSSVAAPPGLACANLERDRLIGGITLEIAERMLAGVGFETNRRLSVLGNFSPR